MTDALLIADQALAKVGTTLEELRRHGGSLLTTGPAHLVGSLAQGFGNRGSDVDVHVFSPEVPRPAPPYLFFIGSLTVDVEHYPATYAEDVTSRLPSESVVTKLGRMTPEVTLGHEETGRLTRWCTAIPIDTGTPPILDDERRQDALAYLLRVALTAVVAAWGTAEVVARSGADAGHLWRVCGRSLLSLSAAAAGYPPIGRKWLPARVARARVPEDFVRSAMSAAGGGDVAELVAGLGLDGLDPLALSRFEPGTGTADVPVGRQLHHLTPLGRLEPGRRPAGGPCAEVLAATGPDEVAALLGAGLLRLTVDERALAAALREVGA
ncbi:hypothetical protein AB0C14_22935 [Microbispora hainanensis]|uniref:hypothetical protein n=1 Tax=Microbispora hainanensis TaxID=568844 RepID=UPI0033D6EE63